MILFRTRRCQTTFRRWFSTFASGPLSGVRVLDLTRILAGPWCTQLLGDMGADVIKIEEPTRGDDSRQWGPPFVHGQSAYFICCNRNKRSVAVNIKHPDGLQLVKDIAAKCDVLVENFLPGKLSEIGLGYEALRDINPGIIYASISGFGATGPSAQRAGYDLAAAAQGGLLSLTGAEGGSPVKVGVAITDLTTGLYMHGAILAALLARGRTGRGQHLDTSLLECQVASLANIGSNVLNCDWPTRRWGTAHESIAPYQAFPASDGEFVLAVMSDSQFTTLCTVLKMPELLTDGRYSTNPLRVKNRGTLVAHLSAELCKQPRQHWIALFSHAGLTVAPINSVGEALADPQVIHRDMVVDIPSPSVGPGARVKMAGIPVKYSDNECRPSIRLPPPLLGEHTDQVLAELLGHDKTRIGGLRQAGAIS